MSSTETTYRAEAWTDPATGFVNVALVRVTPDTSASAHVEVCDGWDCATRRPEYHDVDDFDDEPVPTQPSASLSTNEALALRDALDSVLP